MTETRPIPPTTILVVAPEQNTAVLVERLLRNAGHNPRVEWLGTTLALAERAVATTPGLICVHAGPNEELSKQQLEQCGKSAPGVPVLALSAAPRAQRVAMLANGVGDVVDPEDREHLGHVLERELRHTRRQLELNAVRAQLAQMQTRLNGYLSASGEARATAQQGILEQVNPAFAQMLGFADPQELEGTPLMDLVVPDDRDRVKRALATCVKHIAEQTGVRFQAQSAQAELIPISMHLRPITIEDETAVEAVFKQEQVTAAAEPRAPGGRTALFQALDSRSPQSGLLYLCIDDIDALQSQLGLRQTGQVLDEFAAFMVDSSDPEEACFRLESAEFALLVAATDQSMLQGKAESLRQTVAAAIFGDQTTSTSLAISVAACLLLEASDASKQTQETALLARQLSAGGGNRVGCTTDAGAAAADSCPDTEARERLQQQIGQALKNDGLALAYCAIDGIDGEQQRHYDVMWRLTVAGQGEAAAALQDAADHNGLLVDIERWLVGRVLDLSPQRDETPSLFVPLSAATVTNAEEFLTWLGARTNRLRSRPGHIRFALSEPDVQTHIKACQTLAEGLTKMGFGIALAGYGATRQSLPLLERLPAEFVFLDASLTATPTGQDEPSRLAELTEAARSRQICIIAEPVSDANSMARLWQLGVSYLRTRQVQDAEQPSDQSKAGSS